MKNALTAALILALGTSLLAEGAWYEGAPPVAHAMGGIDGCEYTNSLEAFELNYGLGYRIFEVDLALTSDGEAVLRHDWSDYCDTPEFPVDAPPSLEAFKKAKVYKRFTPLSLDDLVSLMERYRDVYVMTDKLYADTRAIVAKIIEKAPDRGVLDRFIIQVYDIPGHALIDDMHHFEHYVFTLYRRGMVRLDEVADYCASKGIGAVCFPKEWASSGAAGIFKKRGLIVYAHTVNSPAEAEALGKLGVDGFYSDSLLP